MLFHLTRYNPFGRRGEVCLVFPRVGQQLVDPVEVGSLEGNAGQSAGKHSDHPIKKAVTIEHQGNEFLLVPDTDLVDGAGGRFSRLPSIGGKRREIMRSDELVSAAWRRFKSRR